VTPTHTTIRGCLKVIVGCNALAHPPTHTAFRGCLKGGYPQVHEVPTKSSLGG